MKHFQVVCMNKGGFILNYETFLMSTGSIKKMLEYIQFNSFRKEINKIEITRWTDKGERE